MQKTADQTTKSILFLVGAFTFAFLLAEAVHETGHYLAHCLYGNTAILILLDPFGGSRMAGSTDLPEIGMVITSAAGPLFSLIVAAGCFSLLWKRRKPALLPLLLLGPTAMIQEGVNLSLGLFSPNSDAQWILRAGIPAPLIPTAGIVLLIAGLTGVTVLLPLAGVDSKTSFAGTLLIVCTGMCSLLVIRLTGTLITNPEAWIENLVPLGFSGILAVVVTFLRSLVNRNAAPHHLDWNAVGTSLALGAGIFLGQLLLFN